MGEVRAKKGSRPGMVTALVADDTAVDRRILEGILRNHCDIKDITSVSNGREALVWLQTKPFSLVFLDWNMPEKDGIEVLHELRALGMRMPVIMVTSKKEREHVLAAFEAGATDYIVKPYVPRKVGERIRKVTERLRIAPRRIESRRALVADDSAVERKVLAGVLTKTGGFSEVVCVKDGKEAIEAARESDFDIIFLDWTMPAVEGISALRIIRKFREFTPIVMVTGKSDRTKMAEAFEAGATAYILKPFSMQSLSKKIRDLL